MGDLHKHGWKLLVILACYLLASHWDYEDTQRVKHAEYVARVANK